MKRLGLLAIALPALLALILVIDPGAKSIATHGAMGDSNPDFDAIDRYVRSQMEGSRVPGASIAVIEGDRIMHAQGFGTDGRGNDITPQTPFWIGSNTKSVTALAAMQLVEAGKIELNAPVQRYIPTFTTADSNASSQITVRHLMNQTSGFSRDSGIEPLVNGTVQTLEEAVADLESVKLNRAVGESYEYSNLNFVLLGLVIQKVSGQPWGEYVQRYIFDPLGMRNSYTSLDEARAHGLTDVHGYWFGFPFEKEGKNLPGLQPAGWLYSTAEDMSRYLSMYLQGGTYAGNRLLSESGIRAMLSAETNQITRQLQSHSFDLQYGRGWFVGPFGVADDARWHLGNLPSFTAWMVLLPDTNQAVVVLINAGSQFEIGGANEVMSRIPIGIVNILRSERPPSALSIKRFYTIFNAVALTIVVIQGWSLLRVASRSVAFETARGRLWSIGVYVAPLLWELGLATFLVAQYVKINGGSLSAAMWSVPDLTLVLLAIFGLWLVTGVVRVGRLVLALYNNYATSNRGRAESISQHNFNGANVQ